MALHVRSIDSFGLPSTAIWGKMQQTEQGGASLALTPAVTVGLLVHVDLSSPLLNPNSFLSTLTHKIGRPAVPSPQSQTCQVMRPVLHKHGDNQLPHGWHEPMATVADLHAHGVLRYIVPYNLQLLVKVPILFL